MFSARIIQMVSIVVLLLGAVPAKAGTAASFFPGGSSDKPWIHRDAFYIYNSDTSDYHWVVASVAQITNGTSGPAAWSTRVYGYNNGGDQGCYLYALNLSSGAWTSGFAHTTVNGAFTYALSVTIDPGTWALSYDCYIPKVTGGAYSELFGFKESSF